MTKIQITIYNRCLKLNPMWKLKKENLMDIIKRSDTKGDGHKRVTVEGKTYLVPIEDIICIGIKGWELSSKYNEIHP